MSDWTFATRFNWVLSHVFVVGMVLLCGAASFWQAGRLAEVRDQNDVIENGTGAAPVQLNSLASRPPEDLNYLPIAERGQWVEPELIRISNRSQRGVGGDWVVGLFQTDSGVRILVNRGFVTVDGEVEAPPAGSEITGWLQQSQVRSGFFGVVDSGDSERAPRLDVQQVAQRLNGSTEVFPLWLQLSAPAPNTFPDPVPLPELSEGNHLSYSFQWAAFGIMTVIFYGLILRRRARKDALQKRSPAAEHYAASR